MKFGLAWILGAIAVSVDASKQNEQDVLLQARGHELDRRKIASDKYKEDYQQELVHTEEDEVVSDKYKEVVQKVQNEVVGIKNSWHGSHSGYAQYDDAYWRRRRPTPPPPPPTRPPTPAPTPVSHRSGYMGCFGDDSDRVAWVNWGNPKFGPESWWPLNMRGMQKMVGLRVGKHGNVLQKCEAHCQNESFFRWMDWPKERIRGETNPPDIRVRYMAIQDGDECYCLRQMHTSGPYGKKPDADCDSTYRGCLHLDKCGGPWRNAIYELH